jgi:hypothetical protein
MLWMVIVLALASSSYSHRAWVEDDGDSDKVALRWDVAPRPGFTMTLNASIVEQPVTLFIEARWEDSLRRARGAMEFMR